MTDFDFSTAGFYSGDELYPREIKVGDFSDTVHVRKLPAIELRRFQMETDNADPKIRETAGFRALALSIRKEDGSAHMSIEQAKKLKGEAVAELMRVFVDVNRKQDDELGND